jgi:L-seryl-tRNA(Ser) seleniumtransferase
MSGSQDSRRSLPSIDRLLARTEAQACIQRWGRAATAEALRAILDQARTELVDCDGSTPDGALNLARDPIGAARALLERRSRPGLRRVLNGTGVVLHTNLGRAPINREAIEHLVEIAGGYCNLEYDLELGTRGSRDSHCVERIRRLTGSEDALVVNNTAASVALVVNCLAAGRHVVVSRGELVEIGGSFRLPEIVRAAGGILVEVGTTNRTRPEDFRAALGPETGFLLKVHPSNYRIEGFAQQVDIADLAAIGAEAGVPVVHDLGSGLLSTESAPSLPAEPTPADSVRARADLVLWSGDKLLGGPQSGIIHGSADTVARLRGSPLLRALRLDKLALAALESTLILHERGTPPGSELPSLRRLAEPAARVRKRAHASIDALADEAAERVEVVELESLVGGGTFPGVKLESAGWALQAPAVQADRLLRASDPPLVGRIEDERLVIDFRTIAPGREEKEAAAVVSRVLQKLISSGAT